MIRRKHSPDNIRLMRMVGAVLVAACILTNAWIFVPFAVAYMFRDSVEEVFYARTTEHQRALLRFAQWRVMGSAMVSLIAVALWQVGTITVIAIFVIAWADIIFKRYAMSQEAPPPANQPALPAQVTTAVTDRRSDRRIVRP